MKVKKRTGLLKNPYVLVDDNDNVIDDAQGWGYKTAQKAYAAYYYKQNKTTIESTKSKIRQWCKQHKGVEDLYCEIYFDYATHDPEFKATKQQKKNIFLEALAEYKLDVNALPFTIEEFIKFN